MDFSCCDLIHRIKVTGSHKKKSVRKKPAVLCDNCVCSALFNPFFFYLISQREGDKNELVDLGWKKKLIIARIIYDAVIAISYSYVYFTLNIFRVIRKTHVCQSSPMLMPFKPCWFSLVYYACVFNIIYVLCVYTLSMLFLSAARNYGRIKRFKALTLSAWKQTIYWIWAMMRVLYHMLSDFSSSCEFYHYNEEGWVSVRLRCVLKTERREKQYAYLFVCVCACAHVYMYDSSI